jgi:hypothetical protein
MKIKIKKNRVRARFKKKTGKKVHLASKKF